MKIDVKIQGLDAVRDTIAGIGKQARFAAAKTLTQTAHEVNAGIKDEMRRVIQGGPTAFTLRAFKVEAATRDNLTATVALRNDTAEGGSNYTKTFQHLFEGGSRHWKKLEGWLQGRGIVPAGMMVAPGPKAPLDARGNFRKAALKEMLEIITSPTRNLQSWRRSGRGKQLKAIGFFVCRPGDKSGLPPGIWRRISTGKSSAVEPWIMFIRPAAYRQKFDLEKIAKRVVSRGFEERFRRNLSEALRSAR